MYRIRTAGYSKRNPVQRWALPDRVFFACGACHVLAWAFLERYPTTGAVPLWIKPIPPYRNTHIVVATRDVVFDYDGYADRSRFLAHTVRKAQRWWPGWGATLVELSPAALLAEGPSATDEGLWLRPPDQFLHDALPRARAFLDRFPPPPAGTRCQATSGGWVASQWRATSRRRQTHTSGLLFT